MSGGNSQPVKAPDPNTKKETLYSVLRLHVTASQAVIESAYKRHQEFRAKAVIAAKLGISIAALEEREKAFETLRNPATRSSSKVDTLYHAVGLPKNASKEQIEFADKHHLEIRNNYVQSDADNAVIAASIGITKADLEKREEAFKTLINPDSRAAYDDAAKLVTLYDVIGLPVNASKEQIESAYQRHREILDRIAKSNVDITDILGISKKELERRNNAFITLRNPDLKAAYDKDFLPKILKKRMLEETAGMEFKELWAEERMRNTAVTDLSERRKLDAKTLEKEVIARFDVSKEKHVTIPILVDRDKSSVNTIHFLDDLESLIEQTNTISDEAFQISKKQDLDNILSHQSDESLIMIQACIENRFRNLTDRMREQLYNTVEAETKSNNIIMDFVTPLDMLKLPSILMGLFNNPAPDKGGEEQKKLSAAVEKIQSKKEDEAALKMQVDTKFLAVLPKNIMKRDEYRVQLIKRIEQEQAELSKAKKSIFETIARHGETMKMCDDVYRHLLDKQTKCNALNVEFKLPAQELSKLSVDDAGLLIALGEVLRRYEELKKMNHNPSSVSRAQIANAQKIFSDTYGQYESILKSPDPSQPTLLESTARSIYRQTNRRTRAQDVVNSKNAVHTVQDLRKAGLADPANIAGSRNPSHLTIGNRKQS